MKLSSYIVLLMLLLSVEIQAETNCNSLNNISWLLGNWTSNSSKRTYVESWRKVSKDTYEGHSQVTSKDGKTTGYESLRLVNMSGDVFYLAKVSENALPIAFKLASCTANSALFQNITHDFPQSIKYSQNEKSLSVSVKGKNSEGFNIYFNRDKKQPSAP
jgi:Domain of unknown function (DUF6265)